jgi:hypothetical protein
MSNMDNINQMSTEHLKECVYEEILMKPLEDCSVMEDILTHFNARGISVFVHVHGDMSVTCLLGEMGMKRLADRAIGDSLMDTVIRCLLEVTLCYAREEIRKRLEPRPRPQPLRPASTWEYPYRYNTLPPNYRFIPAAIHQDQYPSTVARPDTVTQYPSAANITITPYATSATTTSTSATYLGTQFLRGLADDEMIRFDNRATELTQIANQLARETFFDALGRRHTGDPE